MAAPRWAWLTRSDQGTSLPELIRVLNQKLSELGRYLATIGGVFHASGPSHSTGIVPDPGASAGSTKFLREDATWAVPGGGGAGEANTASNVNVGGAGVFKQKTGVNLEFRGVDNGSSKITATLDATNNRILIDAVPEEINFVLANQVFGG